jgi:hypothetical protein
MAAAILLRMPVSTKTPDWQLLAFKTITVGIIFDANRWLKGKKGTARLTRKIRSSIVLPLSKRVT